MDGALKAFLNLNPINQLMENPRMTLQARIESLLTRLATEFKTIHGQIGSLDALSTTEKGSLVGAINDLRSQISAIGGGTGGTGGAVIDDSNTGGTATTLSASKIVSLLDALKAELLGGADAAFDTLKELQDAVAADQTGLASVLTALDARVRVEDVGNTDADLVAVFEQALATTSDSGDTPATPAVFPTL